MATMPDEWNEFGYDPTGPEAGAGFRRRLETEDGPEILYAKREAEPPYHWIVRDENGKLRDRDKYSNDLRDRFRAPMFNLVFIE